MAALITRQKLLQNIHRRLLVHVVAVGRGNISGWSSIEKLINSKSSRIRSNICYSLANFGSVRHLRIYNAVSGQIIPFKLSDIGEGIMEVSMKEWFVKPGDSISQFDNVCEVQSDKASVTITSRYDGTVKKLYYEVDDVATVGSPLIDIEIADSQATGEEFENAVEETISASKSAPVDTPVEATMHTTSSKKLLATPAVRKLIMENKIDITKVPGTGKDGRVLKEDVLRYLDQLTAPAPISEPIQVPSTPISRPAPVEDGIPVPIRGIRKAMVKSMTESLKVPQLLYCDEVNMNNLMKIISDLKHDSTEDNNSPVRIGMMPFAIKAASLGLKEVPILNSSVDETCENIIYKKSHNIAFAMDSEHGLVVPNIKNVQEKSIMDIALEFKRLIELGVAGKLGVDDLSGGTFSLSNIGSIGGTYSHPVVTVPQVAIGALGKTQTIPRFNESGEVYAAQIMSVSWSADHRIIEGAIVARFSNLWKSYLENPHKMMLHLK